MPAEQSRARLISLTDALTNGVHWGQVLRQQRVPAKGDAVLFGLGDKSPQQTTALHQAFLALLTIEPQQFVGWTNGQAVGSARQIDALVAQLTAAPPPASPKLPVNLLREYMRRRLAGPEEFFVRAVANLGQLNLEVDHDGTLLQDLLRIYIALGIKQLHLPSADAEQIADGRQLAQQSAAGPFDTGPDAYRMIFKKLLNWTEKQTGQRDTGALAGELMSEAEIRQLLPALQALSPRRVAFLGHSMMMAVHWSTYGSWCDVAGEVAKRVNPRFEYRDFQSGGLTPSRAIKEHLDALLAYQPTETYCLMFVRNQSDQQAYDQIVAALKARGSTVVIVDDVRPWLTLSELQLETYRQLAERHGVVVLDYMARGRQAPDNADWEALDQIHMNTPGHLFYARQLLKRWAGQ